MQMKIPENTTTHTGTTNKKGKVLTESERTASGKQSPATVAAAVNGKVHYFKVKTQAKKNSFVQILIAIDELGEMKEWADDAGATEEELLNQLS